MASYKLDQLSYLYSLFALSFKVLSGKSQEVYNLCTIYIFYLLNKNAVPTNYVQFQEKIQDIQNITKYAQHMHMHKLSSLANEHGQYTVCNTLNGYLIQFFLVIESSSFYPGSLQTTFYFLESCKTASSTSSTWQFSRPFPSLL